MIESPMLEKPIAPPWLDLIPEPGPDPAPWGLRGAAAITAMALCGQLILAYLLVALSKATLKLFMPGLARDPGDLRDAAATVAVVPFAFVSYALTLSLVYFSVVDLCHRPFLSSLGFKRPSLKPLGLSILAGLSVAAIVLGLMAVVPPGEDQELAGPLGRLAESGPLGHAFWILIAMGLAPLAEEVLFRGYIYLGVRQSLGPIGAGALTTLLFTVMHMTATGTYWPAIGGVLLGAILLVVVMERTGNLTYCITIHTAYNGTLAAVSFFYV